MTLGRSALPALLLSSTVLVASFAGCAATDDDLRILGFEPNGDAGPSGPLSTPPVEEAGATVMCIVSECQSPYTTCPMSTFQCGTRLDNDIHNCGACDLPCPSGEDARSMHEVFTCTDGRCRGECQADYADCDGVAENGCETSLKTSSNCGQCGNDCGEIPCQGGAYCGCPPGEVLCGQSCVDTNYHENNCGRCFHSCFGEPVPSDPPPPNMFYGCSGAACGKPKCAPFYENCDHVLGNGCEINLLTDHDNCGECGHECDSGQVCFSGECQCGPGQTRCPVLNDGHPTGDYFCADLDSNTQNCGRCGAVCLGMTPSTDFFLAPLYTGHGFPTCNFAQCDYACQEGYGNCDGDSSNGCETSFASDPNNCGGCGHRCRVEEGQPCIKGRCLEAPCGTPGTAPVAR